MPLRRVGYGSDFVIKNQNVGIGTTNPTAKLQVGGTLKGELNITGVSDFASYNGFVGQKQNVSVASTIGFTTTGVGTFTQPNERETGFLSLVGEYNTVSEDLIVDEGKIFEVSTTNITGITTLGTQEVYAPDDSVVSVGTLESVSIQSHFSFPDGGINDRPDQPTEGMVRFNDDLNTLEFYNGIEWRQFTVSGASGRAVFAGGVSPSFEDVMDYININTFGNSIDFGNLTSTRFNFGSCSSSVRGLWGGGTEPTYVNKIEYATLASKGNSITFGTLSTGNRAYNGSCSSSTRGLWGGGYQSSPLPNATVNTIDYVEISTLGNALDFGDLFTGRYSAASCSSPTRGVWAGGNIGSPAFSVIDFVTISSKGDAVRFGDLTIGRRNMTGTSCSSSTRGIFAGGGSPVSFYTDTIDYITISSEGNAIDFGNQTISRQRSASASTEIRGVWAGGTDPSAGQNNTIDYVTIASTGNAQDFGDLSTARGSLDGCSDSHGGLGGF